MNLDHPVLLLLMPALAQGGLGVLYLLSASGYGPVREWGLFGSQSVHVVVGVFLLLAAVVQVSRLF